jgi:serine/threonine protein kinase
MQIERESLIRASGHFEVFESTISNIFQDQKFEDKAAMVQNDDQAAVESLTELFRAFQAMTQLTHKHIQQPRYFLNRYDANQRKHHFHLLMASSGAQPMTQYLLARSGQVTNVALVRQISTQVLQALRYLHEKKLIHGNFNL